MASRQRPESVRDPLTAAKHRADEARGIWRVHLKVCAQCYRAGANYDRLCDEGWAMVKAITRTGNRVRKLTEQAQLAARQGTLW